MSDRTTAIGVEIDAAPRRSAVSWGAVLAGALVAIAVTFALLVLGSGLGLTLVSPWWHANADATTIAVSTIVWLVVMQWASSGIGGYMTGRLRTRWSVNPDEVFFRDTAHGILMWAVATVIIAGLAGQGLMGALSAGAQVAGKVAGGAAAGATAGAASEAADPTAYFVDTLFRPVAATGTSAATPPVAAPVPTAPSVGNEPASPSLATPATPSQPPAETRGPRSAASPATPESAADLRAETLRIILRGMTGDSFPDADRTYLVQRVAAATGMSQQEADARVNQVLQSLQQAKAEAQSAAEKARKAAITLAVVAFVSLMVGAFIGGVAAALGGSHRDDVRDELIAAR